MEHSLTPRKRKPTSQYNIRGFFTNKIAQGFLECAAKIYHFKALANRHIPQIEMVALGGRLRWGTSLC